MRAVQCNAWGELGNITLAELPPPPPPGPGKVAVEVAAAGVNFADILMITGKYQERPMPPFTPGLEVAGRVSAVGAGVQRVKPGDRVLAMLDHGGFAEKVVAKESDVFRDSRRHGLRRGRRLRHRLWHLPWRPCLARRAQARRAAAGAGGGGRRRPHRGPDRQGHRRAGHRVCRRRREARDRQGPWRRLSDRLPHREHPRARARDRRRRPAPMSSTIRSAAKASMRPCALPIGRRGWSSSASPRARCSRFPPISCW